MVGAAEKEMGELTAEEMEEMSEPELRSFVLAYVAKLRGLQQATLMQNQQLRSTHPLLPQTQTKNGPKTGKGVQVPGVGVGPPQGPPRAAGAG